MCLRDNGLLLNGDVSVYIRMYASYTFYGDVPVYICLCIFNYAYTHKAIGNI